MLVSKHSFENCHLCFSASILSKTVICVFRMKHFKSSLKKTSAYEQALFVQTFHLFFRKYQCKSSLGKMLFLYKHSFENNPFQTVTLMSSILLCDKQS